MRLFILLSVFLSMVSAFEATAQSAPLPCGTVSYRSAWLKRYQAQPHTYRTGIDTVLQVPLQVFVVGNDGATGFYSNAKVLDALCTLNEDFSGANIQFYLKNPIVQIANSAYNNHATVLEGAQMMFENNVDSAINCYIVSDPAGNCGYNLPYAGVALNKSCIGVGDHTWAHELGHALHLPHPFLGWEGGVSWDGSVPHNFNDPAPTRVTFDYTYFKDTLIIDTLIIDTAWVELVDGSNCNIAADGFCDTAPDYLSYRWQCNAEDSSTVIQTDPTGAKFKSDGSLFMSYSFDECSSRFSPQQIAAMRADLYDDKPELLTHQVVPPLVNAIAPVLASPLDSAETLFNSAVLTWYALPNATQYIVQVSRFASFNLYTEYTVADTALTVNNLLADKYYHWRVRGFNSHSFCTPMSAKGIFKAVMSVNTIAPLEGVRMHVQPTVWHEQGTVQIDNQSGQRWEATLQLTNLMGQPLHRQTLQVPVGTQTLTLSAKDLPKGMYVVSLQVQGSHVGSQKIIIQ